MDKNRSTANNPYNVIKPDHFNWFRNLVYSISCHSIYVVFSSIYKHSVYGREKIPKEKTSFVVAAKHIASYDPFLISSALYPFLRVAWMAKKELFEKPLMAKYIYSTGSFSINREKIDVSSIRSAKVVLQSGNWCLGIFPEGTRNNEGTLEDTKKGTGFFAKMCKSDIVPVGLAKDPKTNETIICIGDVIPYQDDIDALNLKVAAAIRELTETAEEKLNAG